jgi:hypothetical protein
MPKLNDAETTRRRMLRAGLSMVGGAIAIGTAHAEDKTPGGNQATGQPTLEKFAPEAVGYQPTPNDWQKCLFCTYFQAPSTCAIVTGTVSSKGWCTRFTLLHE